MKRCLILLVFVQVYVAATAVRSRPQSTDVVIQKDLERIVSKLEAIRSHRRDTLLSDVGKCGLAMEAISNWDAFSAVQRSRLIVLLSPLVLEKDTVIERFRIHFDSSNVNGNEPTLLDSAGRRIPDSWRAYVDSVGSVFNHVWTVEIDSLGYSAPPLEPQQNRFNVYIANLGSSLYGYTWLTTPGQPVNPGELTPRYTIYVVIHHDFSPVYSKGIGGLKVTAAHEFHHAVQFGSYGYRDNDLFFYETTSTWMEDVVYDDVNDYYQYIRTASGLPGGHFLYPHKSFDLTDGSLEYSRAIWGKYLEKRFSRGVMRRAWEHVRQFRAIQALNAALGEHGMSFREAFTEFACWNYFTSGRADATRFYTDGGHHPFIGFRDDSLAFQSPLSVFSDNGGVKGLGTAYFRVFLDPGSLRTIVMLVSNVNLTATGGGSAAPYQYVIRSSPPGDESYKLINEGGSTYWVKVGAVGNHADWQLAHISEGAVVTSVVSELLVYPNPITLPDNHWVRFQVPHDGTANLYVFSAELGLAGC